MSASLSICETTYELTFFGTVHYTTTGIYQPSIPAYINVWRVCQVEYHRTVGMQPL